MKSHRLTVTVTGLSLALAVVAIPPLHAQTDPGPRTGPGAVRSPARGGTGAEAEDLRDHEPARRGAVGGARGVGARDDLLRGQPAALLIFTIHKHQVTVLLSQQPSELALSEIPKARAGFTIHSAIVSHLHIIAVSDVNPAELDLLIAALARVQG